MVPILWNVIKANHAINVLRIILLFELSLLMILSNSARAFVLSSLSSKPRPETSNNHASVNMILMMKHRRELFQDMASIASTITTTNTLALLIPSTKSSVAHALTPTEASQAYDQYATTYDELDGGTMSDMFGMDQARSALLAQAHGSVLEIGCGTGLNLNKYDLSKVSSLTLVDVSTGMLQQAKQRVAWMRQQSLPQQRSSSFHSSSLTSFPNDELLKNIRFVQADATSELVQQFGTSSFDTVVDTFSFCVMGNKGARDCLQQMVQVVVKGKEGKHGQLLLLEHTRSSSNPWLGWYQDVTADTAAVWGGKGCVYNQDVSKMIQDTVGIEVVRKDVYAAGLFAGYTCQVNFVEG
jgi:methyltransferase OMS1, mitochondrial